MKNPHLISLHTFVRPRRKRRRLYHAALGLALAVLVFALPGCAETRLGPPEAYTIGGDPRYPEAGLTTADFEGAVVVNLGSPGATSAACRARTANSRAAACAGTGRTGICNIWIAAPLDGDDIAFFRAFRHELAHCKYGAWHD